MTDAEADLVAEKIGALERQRLELDRLATAARKDLRAMELERDDLRRTVQSIRQALNWGNTPPGDVLVRDVYSKMQRLKALSDRLAAVVEKTREMAKQPENSPDPEDRLTRQIGLEILRLCGEVWP